MKRLKELELQRQSQVDIMSAINTKCTTEKRQRSDEEVTAWNNAKAEIDRLDDEIEQARLLAADQAKYLRSVSGGFSPAQDHMSDGDKRELNRVAKRLNLGKALKRHYDGKEQEGVEAEMHQHATRNGAAQKGYALPGELVDMSKRATMVAGTNNVGGHTIATELGDLIPVLRPSTVIAAAGANMLTGLTSNVDMPVETSAPSTNWKAETATADETNSGFDARALTPKRLTAWVPYSIQLLMQSDHVNETMIRQRLEMAIAESIDLAAINGSGTAPVPLGILNIGSIPTLPLGTNGGVPTWPNFVKQKGMIKQANGMLTSLAYITTPAVASQAESTAKDAGSGRFVYENGQIAGVPVYQSSLVPSNLTKGTASGVCHAVIAGDFSQLYVGQFGNYYFDFNNASAKDGKYELIVNTFADVTYAHKESFAVIKDALVS